MDAVRGVPSSTLQEVHHLVKDKMGDEGNQKGWNGSSQPWNAMGDGVIYDDPGDPCTQGRPIETPPEGSYFIRAEELIRLIQSGDIVPPTA